MAKRANPPKKERTRSGLLTKLVILALLVAIGWQLYGLREDLETAKAEKESYAAQVAEQQQENAALAADIAEGPTEEKLQDIARNELGLVKPDEYVFEPVG